MKKRILRNRVLLVLFMLPILSYGQRQQFNILDLGAKPDGITDNTAIIQQAIDKASASGNGTVLLPAGKFLTGVLHLKSNIDFHLSEGAVLLGTAKRADYGTPKASALIEATRQHNISITGKGVIDGQGEALLKDIYVMLNAGTLEDKEWQQENPWHQIRPEERNRPHLVNFLNCDSILVKGISIRNGLCWVQDYRNSTNIIIDSITVESNIFWNNDGIDITDSKNVRITNCVINADDDGICLKSSDRNGGCENIYVANCTVRSSASAVKLGTASWGGFKKIMIRDITVYDTFRSAIAIECVDGGVLDGVDVRNVKATNTGNAIFIRLGHRNKDTVYSQLRNVHIANVRVEIPKGKPDAGYPMEGPRVDGAHNVFPASVTGLPGHAVQNVTLENIEMLYEGGADKHVAFFSLDTLTRVPERESNYPEFTMFGELPAWGFYARHVEGLHLKNVTFRSKNDDFRSACVFDAIDGLTLTNIAIPAATSLPVIVLNDVKQQSVGSIKMAVPKKKGILIRNSRK